MDVPLLTYTAAVDASETKATKAKSGSNFSYLFLIAQIKRATLVTFTASVDTSETKTTKDLG